MRSNTSPLIMNYGAQGVQTDAFKTKKSSQVSCLQAFIMYVQAQTLTNSNDLKVTFILHNINQSSYELELIPHGAVCHEWLVVSQCLGVITVSKIVGIFYGYLSSRKGAKLALWSGLVGQPDALNLLRRNAHMGKHLKLPLTCTDVINMQLRFILLPHNNFLVSLAFDHI